jgi:hypothetical protein
MTTDQSRPPAQSPELPKQTKRSLWRARLLLLLCSLLFCLIVIELGLRLAGFSYPEFYSVDSRRGYALRAGVAGWYRKEGEAYVTINDDGLRDSAHSKAKPSNTFRIAVLGDSYTEALQVPFENSFCAVLERKLRECPPPPLPGTEVEVINFGVSGYGTAQELITLRDHVWQYSPDLVLLAVTTNNDITDNVRELKGVNQIPYFLVLRDGTLVEDQSFLKGRSFRLRQSFIGRLGRWFRDHLRIVQGIDLAIRNYKVARSVRQATPGAPSSPANPTGAASPAPLADVGIDNQIYREPSNPVWNEAWRTTEALIKTIDEEVRSHGAQFLVVTLSNGIQVTPNPQTRAAFLQAIGARDIFYPDTRIRDFCQREKIPVLTLAPSLQKYAESHNAFLHGFGENLGNGHWNLLGNQVAGELVATELCAMSATH